MNRTLKQKKHRIRIIYKRIVDRLPDKYYVKICLYANIYTMLRAYADGANWDYQSMKKYYNKYLDNNIGNADTGYINSKYHPTIKRDRGEEVFRILAFAGRPIMINANRIGKMPQYEIAFLILHEIAHMILPKKHTERDADNFAYRWVRILIKEKLIRGPK